jgi:hypothetical protein
MRGSARLAGTLAGLALLGSAGRAQTPQAAPTNEPDTSKTELKETKDRLQAFEAENESLRRRDELNKNAIRTLDESLAVANAESEFFKRQYGELKLRMEALGMESVGDNKEALEQRLLKAVRDLALIQKEKDGLSERLVALAETVLVYIKTAKVSNPQLRMDVEAQLRAANESLGIPARQVGNPAAVPADLTNASVISVKEDLALIVGNVGSKHGVKLGMPFRVTRGDHAVGEARVIDVRDRICGAIIEDLSSTTETVKIGDQLRVDTHP